MMDMQTIGLIFAIVGVVVTIGYFALGISGINILRDIRDNIKNDQDKGRE